MDSNTQNQAPQPVPGQGTVVNVVKKGPVGSAKLKSQSKSSPNLLLGLLNKDTILLGTIVILILLVIAMAVFVLGAVTNAGFQVTFEQASNTTDNTTNQEDSTTKTSDVSFMMLAYGQENEGKTFTSPAQALDLGGAIDAYLYPVSVKTEVSEGEELQTALELLFAQDSVIFEGYSLATSLDLSAITVTVQENGTETEVQLTGQLIAAGDISSFYMMNQIEKTIEQYTSNYAITLNGSSAEYDCFGDLSGECS